MVSWRIRGVANDIIRAGKAARMLSAAGFEGGVARAGEREVYWYLWLRADQFSVGLGKSRHAGQAAAREAPSRRITPPRLEP